MALAWPSLKESKEREIQKRLFQYGGKGPVVICTANRVAKWRATTVPSSGGPCAANATYSASY